MDPGGRRTPNRHPCQRGAASERIEVYKRGRFEGGRASLPPLCSARERACWPGSSRQHVGPQDPQARGAGLEPGK
eukprot:scaffold346_cov387-Prasinococcus_capsulatus_cf.AAC.17